MIVGEEHPSVVMDFDHLSSVTAGLAVHDVHSR